MRLGSRLKKVLSLVGENLKCVFDVGADHGFLTLALINKNHVKKVIASDISEDSLNKTRKLVKEHNIQNFVDCFVADGLLGYPSGLSADCVVIAGMGENEIIKILKNIKDFSKYDSFIFQPMQNAESLRKYLFEESFQVVHDETILDKNKYYSVIKAKKTESKTPYKEEDLWFGKTDLENLGGDFLGLVRYIKRGLELKKEHLTESEKKKLRKCEEILKIN